MSLVSLGPPPTYVDGTQMYPKGQMGIDNIGQEYIYLPGCSSGTQYDAVTFDEDFVTTRLVPDAVGPVAVFSGTADATTKFCWACVRSAAYPVRSDTVAAGAIMMIDTGAGRVDDATVAGDTVLGMYSQTTDTYSGSSNLTKCALTYPSVTNNPGLST